MRFYFGFQKNFMTDSLTSKFYFISALTLSQIVLYFSNKSSSSIKKYIHLVAYHCIFISTCFRKLYIEWLKFMVIIQVTSKAFIVFFFFKPCWILTLSQYLHRFEKIRVFVVKFIYLNFDIPKR